DGFSTASVLGQSRSGHNNLSESYPFPLPVVIAHVDFFVLVVPANDRAGLARPFGSHVGPDVDRERPEARQVHPAAFAVVEVHVRRRSPDFSELTRIKAGSPRKSGQEEKRGEA